MPDKAISKRLSGYTPDLALAICEAIAGGEALTDVLKAEGMPTRPTVYRWLAAHQEFADAYERAREISAQVFEEKALGLAAELTAKNDFTGTKVRAYEVAMGQLRWSAARRDPKRYGQKADTTGQMNIQINTSLAMPGTASALTLIREGEKAETEQEKRNALVDDLSSIYTIDVPVASPPKKVLSRLPEVPEDAPEVEPTMGVEENPEDDVLFPLPPKGHRAPLQAADDKRKLPVRRKGHKTAAGTKNAITRLRKKKLSPSVKRALGITDGEDE